MAKRKRKSRVDRINETLTTIPIGSWKWPRPVVYVPMERAISYADVVMQWVVGIAQQGVPWIHVTYGPADNVRNQAAQELLKTDYTHIVMLDLDHIHPVNIVQRLSRWVLVDKSIQVVGGLNFRRGMPHDPCCSFERNGQWYSPDLDKLDREKLLEVDAIGTGSIMIAREVFEANPMPWFSKPWDDETKKHLSDDIGFSNMCRRAGVSMYVDLALTSPHLNVMGVDERQYRAYREHAQRQGIGVETLAGVINDNN